MAQQNHAPRLADILAVDRAGSTAHTAEEMEKAANEVALGQRHAGLTKEAQEQIVGTLAWGGRAFGEECGKGMEPYTTKLAQVTANLTAVLAEFAKLADSGIAGIGGVRENIHTPAQDAPNQAGALPDNASMGDSPTGFGEGVAAAIENLKTKRVVHGATMAGGKRTNPGTENTQAYARGKKAAFEEMLQHGLIDQQTFDKIAAEIDKSAGFKVAGMEELLQHAGPALAGGLGAAKAGLGVAGAAMHAHPGVAAGAAGAAGLAGILKLIHGAKAAPAPDGGTLSHLKDLLMQHKGAVGAGAAGLGAGALAHHMMSGDDHKKEGADLEALGATFQQELEASLKAGQ